MNDTNPPKSESVALLIRHKVKKGELVRYEQWLDEIVAIAAKREGHEGAQIIRPLDEENEYLIIIRFTSAEAAAKWTKSAERMHLLSKIADALDIPERPEIHPGVDFWFAPPPGQRTPKGWKQWLVTTSVIWPVSTLVQFLFIPLFTNFPMLNAWGVRQGIVTMAVVALVVFLIMPRYVRALAGWLYR
ncbi:antibiotic biosynthesis monooxygenase [Hymenobacter lucidus]|uniref:Antibiotic biosynthesis monooxygenase n=1 Tax=Hymenobacter lucidus TaxID=2880930 RepID=A0ABS8AYZ5_9BACT|nr:antibiotic biosynthesis monooxygenase [Hymenobacter lucidus]MCB2411031.1 antibiotic biosynthesis monooxygenase [Hymenobacter lucidus]